MPFTKLGNLLPEKDFLEEFIDNIGDSNKLSR